MLGTRPMVFSLIFSACHAAHSYGDIEDNRPEQLCVAACFDTPDVSAAEQPCGSKEEQTEYCVDACLSALEGRSSECAECLAAHPQWDAGCGEWECSCSVFFETTGVATYFCSEVCEMGIESE